MLENLNKSLLRDRFEPCMSNKLIDKISLPDELSSLNISELEQVTLELREELIDTISDVGGHFASSLGAAEITVALHHCFNTPKDRLVWDVGHQAYFHKMLTGRRERMHTIKQKNGISGYLKRKESEYDTFGAGHAGTSISAGVGMASALREIDPDRKIVSIIGDASIASGMAFEALNHAGSLKLNNLIVVLNDNEMSIAPNVGAISWLFSKAVTSNLSNHARTGIKTLKERGMIPELVYKAIDKAEEMAQGYMVGAAVLFEAFGFRYIGPVDGHNMNDLVVALERAKTQDVPVLIHAATQKGRGYSPAEVDPVKWHGVKPFNKDKGEFLAASKTKTPTPPSYSKVFSDAIRKITRDNNKIRAITAAMPSGTGLDKFAKEFPEKFFDVGICEQHAITFAAGLACEGLKPVCAIYSTFLQRAFDQIVHDVCIQNLPVVFSMDRAGAVGNDGETHQGVFDIAYLRTLPNIVVSAPKDENELQHLLYTGINSNKPFALRYPRGSAVGVEMDKELKKIEIGKGEKLVEGKEVLVIAYGASVQTALNVSKKFQSVYGYSLSVINARFVKPLDKKLIEAEINKHNVICTIEDHALMGGFGSAILEFASEMDLLNNKKVFRFGIQDKFVEPGSQNEQYELNGYDEKSVFNTISKNLNLNKVVSLQNRLKVAG